jgi:hypothetical protein
MDNLWLGIEKILRESSFGINTEAKNTGTNIQVVSCNSVQISNVGNNGKENFKEDDKRKKRTLEVSNYCRLASIFIIHELFCFLFFSLKSIQKRNHVNRTQWKR